MPKSKLRSTHSSRGTFSFLKVSTSSSDIAYKSRSMFVNPQRDSSWRWFSCLVQMVVCDAKLNGVFYPLLF